MEKIRSVVEEVADVLHIEPGLVIVMATKMCAFQREDIILKRNLERYNQNGHFPDYVRAFCLRVLAREV